MTQSDAVSVGSDVKRESNSEADVRDWQIDPMPFPVFSEEGGGPSQVFKPLHFSFTDNAGSLSVPVIPVMTPGNDNRDAPAYEIFYGKHDRFPADLANFNQLYTAMPYQFESITRATLPSVVMELMQILSFSGKTPALLRIPMVMNTVGKTDSGYTVSVDVYTNPEFPRSYMMPRIRIKPLEPLKAAFIPPTATSRENLEWLANKILAKELSSDDTGRPNANPPPPAPGPAASNELPVGNAPTRPPTPTRPVSVPTANPITQKTPPPPKPQPLSAGRNAVVASAFV